MIDLLKEVGRGKRGARDLTYEEARRAAELIVEGGATDAQTGAFLVAERIKMENEDEIAAFADVLRRHALRRPLPGAVDCAGPYDGRAKSFFATLPAAFLLAACGVPAALHGSRALPPKWGVTLPDILGVWGVDCNTPAGLERLLAAGDETGVQFVPAELGCPPLARMREIRTQLGLRTVFNTAEKLMRYAEAPYLALGIFHGTVFEKTAHLASRYGFRRALIIQGVEGSEDVTVGRRTRMLLAEDGQTELVTVDPEALGVQAELPETEWTAERQADIAEAVLRGDDSLPAFANMAVLNAGIRLWLAGAAATIEAGIGLARDARSSGQADRLFRRWLASVKRSGGAPT